MVLKWSTECLESDCWKMLFKMKLFNFKMNWDLLFCFLFRFIDFFLGSPRWLPCGSPLCFPIVLTVARAPGEFCVPKPWRFSLFLPMRARVSVTWRRLKISKVSGRKLSSNYDLKIISKLTDFLLLCVLKSAYFFIAKGLPHKWWRSMVSNANLDFQLFGEKIQLPETGQFSYYC